MKSNLIETDQKMKKGKRFRFPIIPIALAVVIMAILTIVFFKVVIPILLPVLFVIFIVRVISKKAKGTVEESS